MFAQKFTQYQQLPQFQPGRSSIFQTEFNRQFTHSHNSSAAPVNTHENDSDKDDEGDDDEHLADLINLVQKQKARKHSRN